jgi:hypothetical protein
MSKDERVLVTLLDGPHVLKRPSLYALAHLADHGFNVSTGVNVTDPRFVAAGLAALLTDSELIDEVTGEPAKIWTPTEAAKLVDASEEAFNEVQTKVSSLIFPELFEGDGEPKGKGAGGEDEGLSTTDERP